MGYTLHFKRVSHTVTALNRAGDDDVSSSAIFWEPRAPEMHPTKCIILFSSQLLHHLFHPEPVILE